MFDLKRWLEEPSYTPTRRLAHSINKLDKSCSKLCSSLLSYFLYMWNSMLMGPFFCTKHWWVFFYIKKPINFEFHMYKLECILAGPLHFFQENYQRGLLLYFNFDAFHYFWKRYIPLFFHSRNQPCLTL